MAEDKNEVEETKTEVTENKEELKDDKEGEAKEEENEGTEKEESFDEEKIDPEVRNYKPAESKQEEEDDEIDQEDKARIEKVIEKKYGGDISQIKQKVEMDAFFNSNPELGKYRHAVELYKAHPAYSNVPIHNLAAMVSAKDMQKIGAAKERAAARAVEETRNPGGTVRKPSGEALDWKSVSKDDFEAQKAKVLGRMGN
jgi:hypothetical protein